MAHLRTKLTTAFYLRRTTPHTRRSSLNMGQVTETPGSAGTAPRHPALPSPAGHESTLTDNVNFNHTQVETSVVSRTVHRWRSKVFPAIARKRTLIARTPSAFVPAHTSGHYIGPAILISGLAAAAPLHAVSPPTAAFESTPNHNVDLGRAKSALRVLSALGDGVAGVPWLKGATELGLEIVNILDVSHLKNG